MDLGTPCIVAADPRYQRETFTLYGGSRRLSQLWHLDGVAWHHALPPQRHGHEHVAQTVGFLGPFEEVWRCPCSAITSHGEHGWLNMEERFAPEPAAPPGRSWIARLLRRR